MLSKKLVRSVLRSLMKRKTSIGPVGHINQPGEAKCGGAAVKEAKTHQDVSLVSTITKRKRMKRLKRS